MKHEKDERSALFEYLDDNDCTIYSYGEAQNEVHELETILEGLQKYDSPDMYAIVGNMLVIIEHGKEHYRSVFQENRNKTFGA